MSMYYYDRQGRPIDLIGYSDLLNTYGEDYKRVAQTTVGKFWVSTVWLGIDHGWDNEGDDGKHILIFETMVFDRDPKSDDHDVYCDRYTTETQALLGHDRVVASLHNGTFTNYNGELVDTTFVIEEMGI